ncbi:peptidase S9, prolyl oligopeptidase active site domain protein [Mycolicibacterium vanbaalenii PYR-1]|uniref:Peptidase S9, prolyl oligopeptidase active site domain protein n=1 Tax=Mycolicibacterium vanbaalenii (strain DSM 7251 / JCM 13017 / BCRC 16820 / KCTC 9966 / NRRL B-24157 / PYR-1) TaxID=350058 RepID=A1THN5_MYCVP|nr:S9 family peptidase [Mycolicibacterium vanbaalenii]ABM16685.1 peptidase S9, prolyl oligopeptidase active site domain protein [Mycolicibacterium vanbaalenii PYR-1]
MALPGLISVEDFFNPPTRAAATISPDGTRMAFLAPWKDRLNVWVQGLEPDADEPRCVTADDHRSVMHFEWTDDPRWLIYLQDTNGDENWHIHRVDLDDPDAAAVDLTPFPGAMAAPLREVRNGTTTVMLNNRDATLLDVHRLDIATGHLTLIATNPGHVNGWLCSDNGDVFATSLTPDGDVELSRWDSATDTLQPIARFDGSDYPVGIHPLVITPDGTGVWLGSHRDTDRSRLVRVDLVTGEETEADSHPELDIDPRAIVSPIIPAPLIQDRRTGELLGVRYFGERQVIRALDPGFGDILTNLENLSDGDVGRLSSDESGLRWVVGFNHDRDPGATYLYDHSTGESRLLFRPMPHLDPEQLAPMRPVTITSRDGLALHSYLTLPVGVQPEGLPLVLVVHGGPWYRDSWGFDAGVQMLANRGYAVLQVNFRGSLGYGKAFLKAAVGEFAGKMHDDLIDGVHWAVEQGYADPDRIAILGGSYGGYAALVGVTFTPDVFTAAVDYVGISDLANFMRTLPPIARPHLANNWHAYVGDPDDPEQLADMMARSPITKVDRIRTPLLVIQGANDVRVVQAESDNLVAALRARGVEVDYLIQADEGHGAVNPENVIEMWDAVARFLARHLGGRA